MAENIHLDSNDELITVQRVKGHNDLLKLSFTHNSKIHTLIMTKCPSHCAECIDHPCDRVREESVFKALSSPTSFLLLLMLGMQFIFHFPSPIVENIIN